MIIKSINDIENLLSLIDIINVILGELEIKKWKTEKSQKYFEVLNKLCINSFDHSLKVKIMEN